MIMSAPPKITVLIPTFNRAKYLSECLDSILGQSLAPTQVIVVNDGSTDNTRHVLKPYLNRIDYLETNQLGKPGALNAGMKIVKGDYLWIFDDDDAALSDALERLIEPLEKDGRYGFSYSSFYFTDTDAKSGRIGSIKSEFRIPDVSTRGFLIPLLEANFLGGAALFARTTCYEKVGLFDLKLLRSQDYEMAIRIARHFKGVRVKGKATFHYRQHQGMRGSLKDRFHAPEQEAKWWAYGQIFFSRLYKELPLHEYLPPGTLIKENKRQALIQRMRVMSSKLLFDEMIMDLEEIKNLNEAKPFNDMERKIIQDMILKVPYYNVGSLFNDCSAFFKWLRRNSIEHKSVRMLRHEVFRNVFRHCKKHPNFPCFIKGVQRVWQLYV